MCNLQFYIKINYVTSFQILSILSIYSAKVKNEIYRIYALTACFIEIAV